VVRRSGYCPGVSDDRHLTDEIVQHADHVARSGASFDDSDTLRELILTAPHAATAAYARAVRLAADAFTDGERRRWAGVGRAIAAVAAAAEVAIDSPDPPR
jgi:hypothetical protein